MDAETWRDIGGDDQQDRIAALEADRNRAHNNFVELECRYEALEAENARLRRGACATANRIEIRLNDHLLDMKPEQDDSVVGFNEAWDVIRPILKDLQEGEGAFQIELQLAAAQEENRRLKAQIPYAWLIHYEDADVNDEIFIGEGAEEAARYRFKQAQDSWNCHLFIAARTAKEKG